MYKVIVDDEGTMFSVEQSEGGSFVCKATNDCPPSLFSAVTAAEIAEDMNNDLEYGELFEFIDLPVGQFVPIFIKLEKPTFLPGGIDVDVH